MMQVIRCEHPEGIRAIQGLEAVDCPELWWSLPTPWRDGGHTMDPTTVCAAPPDRLDIWFPAWVRPLLREQGFRFVALEVPEQALCHTGEYQVVIKRELCIERGEYLQ